MSEMPFDYTSKESLKLLKQVLDSCLTPRQKAATCMAMSHVGLMNLPLPLKATMAVLKFRFGAERAMSVMAENIVKTNLVDEMWRQYMGHMVDGKDTTDPKSAGGFNEAELAKVVLLTQPYILEAHQRLAAAPEAETEAPAMRM